MKRKTKRPSLRDIIFYDRNKDYGAYEIGKNSVRRIRISFLLASSIFILLILIIGGVIRIPWLNHSESVQTYNLVNVKYDPSLITELSKPFKVDQKKETMKSFTTPKIVDMEQDFLIDKARKPAADELKPDEESKERLSDSMQRPAANEIKPELAKARTDTVVFIEQVPQFPGGSEALKTFIRNNLKYPVDAINRKVQGTVIISFVVEKDGSVKRIIITKNVDPVLDFEAVRIIASMPQWQPGRSKGKSITTMIVLPIIFTLRL